MKIGDAGKHPSGSAERAWNAREGQQRTAVDAFNSGDLIQK